MDILRSLRKLNTIDSCMFWNMFDTQIEPMLTYAAEVWGLLNNKQMEKVHTYAIKRFLGVPIHASNQVLYGDTGRYPLFIRTYVKCIRYWLKLLRLPHSRLCRQAYDMMLGQMEHGRETLGISSENSLCQRMVLELYGCHRAWDMNMVLFLNSKID
eukprot:TRINITY_DN4419_c0_g1_i2.p2 TRINITY_DN4419_c0_g1~~TRINITY_DN4419_c0_g1_i2.p2  ORF type:complete len:156 (-),score=4.99 TRINITY_DN4419_c0_g1_i2:160-627(-)